MLLSKPQIVCKIHLVVSVLVVFPVAIVYGFFPDIEFELYPKTMDEHNFYKAIMGLYIGFSMVWVLGIFKNNYLKNALITNIVFMLGLAFGRAVSMVYDGMPTQGYITGAFLELFLGCYGIWVISSKYYKKP